MTKVFVYGTLKKGLGLNYILENSKYLGEATLPNARLVSVADWYPALLPSLDEDDLVKGEVYEVDSDVTWGRLDSVEGAYDRESTIVYNEDGEEEWVEVYVGYQFHNCPDVDPVTGTGIHEWKDNNGKERGSFYGAV